MEEEQSIWSGNPSQILNLHIFLLCLLAAGGLIGAAVYFRDDLKPAMMYVIAGLAVIPLAIAFVRYLQTKFWRYELTTERLRIRRGILSRTTDEIELYRIKDYVLHEPFAMRMVGLGDLAMTTTDDANRNVLLKAVRQPDQLRDQIRKHVEVRRQVKGVRITEME